jgi:hypothetical protein
MKSKRKGKSRKVKGPKRAQGGPGGLKMKKKE